MYSIKSKTCFQSIKKILLFFILLLSISILTYCQKTTEKKEMSEKKLYIYAKDLKKDVFEENEGFESGME